MPTIALPRIQVLVLHHEAVVAFGLAASLSSGPEFEVHQGSPANAVAGSFNVVVCDYDTGLALAQTARACQGSAARGSAPRWLVMTSRSSEQAVRRALETGVHGYVLMDAPLQDLLDGVRALAQGQRFMSRAVAQRMAESLTREALTSREDEVLKLLACGSCNKAIARELKIAVGTVKAHVKAIMGKLDAASRTEAVSVAAQRGLVTLAEPEPAIAGVAGVQRRAPALKVSMEAATPSL